MGIQKCHCSNTKVAYPLVRAIRDHEQRIVPLPLSLSRCGNRYRFFGIDVTRRVLSRHRNLDWWKYKAGPRGKGRYVFGRWSVSEEARCLARYLARRCGPRKLQIAELPPAASTASTTPRWCLFGKRALAIHRSQFAPRELDCRLSLSA